MRSFFFLLLIGGAQGCLICANTGNQKPTHPTRRPTVQPRLATARVCFDKESGQGGQSKDPWASAFWVALGWSGDDEKEEHTDCHVCAQLVNGPNGDWFPEVCKTDGLVNDQEDGIVNIASPARGTNPYPHSGLCIDLQPDYVIGKYQVIVRVKNCPGRHITGDWLGDPMWVDRFSLEDVDRDMKHYGRNDRRGWCMSPVPNGWKGEQECTGDFCADPEDSDDKIYNDWSKAGHDKQQVIGATCHKVLVLNKGDTDITVGYPLDHCEWQQFLGKKASGLAEQGYAGSMAATITVYASLEAAQMACLELPACEVVQCQQRNTSCRLKSSWSLQNSKASRAHRETSYRLSCGGVSRRIGEALSS